METYTIIDAPGYHGDYVTVYRKFDDIHKARAFCKSGGLRILAGCDGHEVGDKIGRGIVQDMINAGHWTVTA
jgi:hypothetical protein